MENPFKKSFPKASSLIVDEVENAYEQLNSFLKKGHMFEAFRACEQELESMKQRGEYQERRNEKGELVAENGEVSHFADYPEIYRILQTPTFRRVIGTPGNVAIYQDTLEPVIVYHSTPIDIPEHEGLKPLKKRVGPGHVLGSKEGLLTSFRRHFKLFPLANMHLFFAEDPNSTKRKAAAATRTGNDPHKIYPCFIRIEKPYLIGGSERSTFSYDECDGIFNIDAKDFSVKSKDQVMQIPFNIAGIYEPE